MRTQRSRMHLKVLGLKYKMNTCGKELSKPIWLHMPAAIR